ncbi:hypothetical protein EW146_g8229 [Bondarzewia mesenterica]|uniref:Uncharacterized protein n=1 Tax=Bondarzewia mesenterica TaxID=1095465 RepID=A0A4S4LG54_9AGAM|nr:hypothetical protein EW146_g8229 [Bondarzewia mesenterica]
MASSHDLDLWSSLFPGSPAPSEPHPSESLPSENTYEDLADPRLNIRSLSWRDLTSSSHAGPPKRNFSPNGSDLVLSHAMDTVAPTSRSSSAASNSSSSYPSSSFLDFSYPDIADDPKYHPSYHYSAMFASPSPLTLQKTTSLTPSSFFSPPDTSKIMNLHPSISATPNFLLSPAPFRSFLDDSRSPSPGISPIERSPRRKRPLLPFSHNRSRSRSNSSSIFSRDPSLTFSDSPSPLRTQGTPFMDRLLHARASSPSLPSSPAPPTSSLPHLASSPSDLATTPEPDLEPEATPARTRSPSTFGSPLSALSSSNRDHDSASDSDSDSDSNSDLDVPLQTRITRSRARACLLPAFPSPPPKPLVVKPVLRRGPRRRAADKENYAPIPLRPAEVNVKPQFLSPTT